MNYKHEGGRNPDLAYGGMNPDAVPHLPKVEGGEDPLLGNPQYSVDSSAEFSPPAMEARVSVSGGREERDQRIWAEAQGDESLFNRIKGLERAQRLMAERPDDAQLQDDLLRMQEAVHERKVALGIIQEEKP